MKTTESRNGINNQDLELGQDADLIKQAKEKYEQSGGQPVKSKMHQEPSQSR